MWQNSQGLNQPLKFITQKEIQVKFQTQQAEVNSDFPTPKYNSFKKTDFWKHVSWILSHKTLAQFRNQAITNATQVEIGNGLWC